MESNFHSMSSSLLMCPSSGSSMIKATSLKCVWLNKVPPHFTSFAWSFQISEFIYTSENPMNVIDHVMLGVRSTLIWLMVYFYFLNSLFSESLISPAPECELDYNCKWSSYYPKLSFPLPGPSSAPRHSFGDVPRCQHLTLLGIDCVTSARQLHFSVPVFPVPLSLQGMGWAGCVQTQLLLCLQIIYTCN